MMPPVAGGPTRQDSVRLGLEALAAYCPQRVLIHDGARPFPDKQLVDRVLDGLDNAVAAIPCLPLRDTIKRAEGGMICETIDRSALWRAQTPQGFHFDAILAAHRAAIGRELTDDAAVAEAAGLAPLIVEGSEDNLKVTTQGDLAAAERLISGPGLSRTGRDARGQLEVPLRQHQGVFAIPGFGGCFRFDDDRTVETHWDLNFWIGVRVIPAGAGRGGDELIGE